MAVMVCCESCGWGKGSTPKEEIEEQKKKYDGVYICKNCENISKNIEVFGKSYIEYIITENGIYEDQGVEHPKSSFLGFGGSWVLLKSVKDDSCFITNNLFSRNRLHEKLIDNFRDNITHKFYWIGSFNTYLDDVLSKEQLEKIKNSKAWEYYKDEYKNFKRRS